MAYSADPDQLASSEANWSWRSQLIWIYTVFNDEAYPGSVGPGFKISPHFILVE